MKKAAGMPLGRPRGPGKSKLDPYQPEIEALLPQRVHPDVYRQALWRRWGTHHWLKQHKITRAKA